MEPFSKSTNSTKKKKKSKSMSSKPTNIKSSKINVEKKSNSTNHKKKIKKKSRRTTTVDSSDDDDDALQYASCEVSNRNNPTPNPSGPIQDLPDPNDMLAALGRGIKPLKLEAKRLFDEMEEIKKGHDQAAKDILDVKRRTQLEKLKGNELIKVDHLLRLGFDETVMKEHLVATNKKLREEIKKKQKDVNNLGSNVQKMITMNKESEKAVSAAHGAYGPLVVKQQTLQAKVEQAEVELYAIQTKVDHRRNMKSVEIASKDKFKITMKEIVRKLQIRCRDQELLHDVLRKAGKSLETDLSLSPVERVAPKEEKVEKFSTKSSEFVPNGSVDSSEGSDSDASTEIEEENDSESISVSSSSVSTVSSVDVSSVES
ncbi:hypothetical protein IV203_011922 [Nitzschia inconspicua]|uniref:Uncharacterized protein n=1 Tax=Nitzschia inconspicua TaxID=303405 RepID=A0A9K3KT00_9STRA|nr:hypothetical protein IV203_011922 [Nitzschia inconspicua]